MMPRAFYPYTIVQGQPVQIVGEAGHHFARVLRVRVGESLAIAAKNHAWLVEVTEVDSKSGSVTVLPIEPIPSHESRTKVWLIQGLAKGDKIETIVQKCTEIGVTGIIIYASSRTVVRLEGSKVSGKLERWRKIAWEAAGQSQRDIVPEVLFASSFEQLVQIIHDNRLTQVLLLDEEERAVAIKQALQSHTPAAGGIALAIGPEGGWDNTEREQWTKHLEATTVTLGPRILRTETAGVVAATAVLYEYGEMGG